MNLILLFKNDFIENTNCVRIKGRRLKHIIDVHRAQPGDRLTVGLENEKIGIGTIRKLNKDLLEMEVNLTIEPPAPSPVNLILALPRPKVISRVLLSASSLGIKKSGLLMRTELKKVTGKARALMRII